MVAIRKQARRGLYIKAKKALTTKTMTIEEFHKEIRKQKVSIAKVTFRCPMCKTLQSINDLIKAGAGKDKEEVEKYIGFSCIGRFNPSQGCDWTLGGLLAISELIVIDKEGKQHPRFLPVARPSKKIKKA